MTKTTQLWRTLRGLVAALVVMTALARVPAQAPAVPGPPPGGMTLLDKMEVESGDIRSQPTMPSYGAWGILIGKPDPDDNGRGFQIAKPGQGVVYALADMVRGDTGTIEFTVIGAKAGEPTPRVLLDTWAVNGNARITLTLVGAKLTLTMTGDNNQATTVEGTPNLNGEVHSATIMWDKTELVLLWDRNTIGKAEKPNVSGREPLGVVFGNSRDFQQPCKCTVSGNVRFSTAREPNASAPSTANDNLKPEEVVLRTARDYNRRLYPFLERLRQQNIAEVPYAYALAYSDINDLDRAKQTLEQQITRDQNHPLYVQGVFLRSDLVLRQKDYLAAFDTLQALVTHKDLNIAISAQIKQAMVLIEQGNRDQARQLMGQILEKYGNREEANIAMLVIAVDCFDKGDYQGALKALEMMGILTKKKKSTFEIGVPLMIKVSDPKQSVRSSDAPLPVTVTVQSGDKETVLLKPAFSRGLYLGTVETELGDPKAGDGKLQVSGDDKVTVTYIDPLSDGEKNKAISYQLDPATDGKLVMMAQSALDIFREAQGYVKKNILDERWNLVGVLPKSASAFFRDPENGNLRKKGFRFDRRYIEYIKPGQAVYVELVDPDLDTTKDADTTTLDLTTQKGKKITITLTESGPHTGIFTATVKTTPLGEPVENLLEVNFNDQVSANYVDQRPAPTTKEASHLAVVRIQSMAGKIAVGQKFANQEDPEEKVFVRAYRVSNGTSLICMIEDRDLDGTDAPDRVTVKLKTDTGAGVDVALAETGPHTGTFSGTFKVTTDAAAEDAPNLLKGKAGDLVTASYSDDENPTGKPVDVGFNFKINKAENATMVFERQVVIYPKADKTTSIADLRPLSMKWEPSTVLVPGSVYRISLIDPDVVPSTTGEMYTKVTLKATNGAASEVELRSQVNEKLMVNVFTGNFYCRLGDLQSPARAFMSMTGAIVDMKEDDDDGQNVNLYSYPAINVQGRDKVTATYTEPMGDDGKRNIARNTDLRVASDAELEILNLQGNPLEGLKPGIAFEVHVESPSGDITNKRDTLKATLTSSCGDKLDAELTETDNHSGVFGAVVKTAYGTKHITDGVLAVPFDGKVTVTYRDDNTIAGTPADRVAELTTRPLTEAEGVLLTKVFDDPKFEVETLVRLGESLYAVGAAELIKANLPKDAKRTNDILKESSRLLQQVVDRFPNSEYVVESLYLTAKIFREEQEFDTAIKFFNRVVDEYPDSIFVPQALYQLVLLYYDLNDIDKATESAMYLVYGFPKDPLVADAFLHIAEFYYNKATKVDKVKEDKVHDYLTSAYIYKRVMDRFADNPRIELIHYRMATAYYRAGLSEEKGASLSTAVRFYLEFQDIHKDHELADDALYWAATAYYKQNNVQRAYTLLIKQLILYPKGDMLSYAQRLRDQIKEKYPNITEDKMM
jgi:TolA-binding protein